MFNILLLCSVGVRSQVTTDSIAEPKADTTRFSEMDTAKVIKHSPAKASLFSMVVPGLGQAYNKKYWKVPLVYAGIGIPLYYAIGEHKGFEDYKSAYRNRISGDSSDKYMQFSNENLLDFIDIKRRNRDLLLIISSVVYVLNIVDASVDAHFFYFDVGDDLSLRVRPSFDEMAFGRSRPTQFATGLRLTLYFN